MYSRKLATTRRLREPGHLYFTAKRPKSAQNRGSVVKSGPRAAWREVTFERKWIGSHKPFATTFWGPTARFMNTHHRTRTCTTFGAKTQP